MNTNLDKSSFVLIEILNRYLSVSTQPIAQPANNDFWSLLHKTLSELSYPQEFDTTETWEIQKQRFRQLTHEYMLNLVKNSRNIIELAKKVQLNLTYMDNELGDLNYNSSNNNVAVPIFSLEWLQEIDATVLYKRDLITIFAFFNLYNFVQGYRLNPIDDSLTHEELIENVLNALKKIILTHSPEFIEYRGQVLNNFKNHPVGLYIQASCLYEEGLNTMLDQIRKDIGKLRSNHVSELDIDFGLDLSPLSINTKIKFDLK